MPGVEGKGAPIRVLVIDDEEDARVLVRDQLADADSIEIVGEGANLEDAAKLSEELTPDVVLLDWAMPQGSGARAAAEIQEVSPSTRVLGFSSGDPTQASYDMMTGGAVGFVSKSADVDELIRSIESVARW